MLEVHVYLVRGVECAHFTIIRFELMVPGVGACCFVCVCVCVCTRARVRFLQRLSESALSGTGALC